MKIATWNVNGIRARAGEVISLLEREQPDVLCLQEIKAPREQVPAPLGDLAGYWGFWNGHQGYSGVGLHLRKATFPQRPLFSHPEFDRETRIVQARAGDLAFASAYVPNGGKDFDAKLRFLEGLANFAAAARASGTRLVLCGDLNVAREERDVHPKLRKQGPIGTTPREPELLAKILGHGLTDLLRKFAPDDDRLFTWWAPWRNLRERNTGWRIDYVLSSQELGAKAVSSSAAPHFPTSHHPPLPSVLHPTRAHNKPPPEPPQAAPEPGQIPLL